MGVCWGRFLGRSRFRVAHALTGALSPSLKKKIPWPAVGRGGRIWNGITGDRVGEQKHGLGRQQQLGHRGVAPLSRDAQQRHLPLAVPVRGF